MQVLELHILLLQVETQQLLQIIHHSPETSQMEQSSGVSQHLIHKDILFYPQVQQLIEIVSVVVVLLKVKIMLYHISVSHLKETQKILVI